MINKIAIIADIHIKNFLRLEEGRASMERFLYDMRENVKPDRIVIVGDLVHSKNQISPEASDLAGWFLEECANIAITIFILGNHDLLVENKDRLDSITPIIRRINSPNIYFYKNSGVYQDENINWVVFSVVDDDHPKIIDKNPDKKYYGLFHGRIHNSETDTGYIIEDGVSPDIFDNLDAVFCGDIHNRFIIKNNIGSPVIMVGSLIQQTYRENLTEHGYCIFEPETGDYTFVNIEGKIKYMTFEITDFEDINTESEVLLNKG